MRTQGQRTEAGLAENHGDGEERMGGFRGQETVKKGGWRLGSSGVGDSVGTENLGSCPMTE